MAERIQKLYFIIGIKDNSYVYKYILASSKKEANYIFSKEYNLYIIEETKCISPSKKLIKLYNETLLKTGGRQ